MGNQNDFELFRYASFFDVFGRVFETFGRRWGVFLGIATIVYLLGWAFALFTSLVVGGDTEIDGFSARVTFRSNMNDPIEILCFVLELITYYCFICVAHGATVWLVAHLYLDQHPTLHEAFMKALDKIDALIGSLFVIGLITLVPMIPFLYYLLKSVTSIEAMFVVAGMVYIYGIFIMVVTYHVYPVIMVENLGPIDSIQRSFELSEGQRCNIFCILFVWGILKSVVGMGISSLRVSDSSNGADINYWSMYIFSSTLDLLFSLLFAALNGVFEAVIYFNVRVAKEDLDCDHLGHELGIEGENYITMTPTGDRQKGEMA